MTDLDLDAVAPPRIVGRYALFDEIAAGGMATVHLGRLVGQVGFSRTVAVKRLHPQYAKDHDFVSMFVDEAKLASRIQHPNVVSTLDVVKTDDELFLVMEYVQGESLSKLVRQAARGGERIPVNIVVSVMSGMLHGLHAAHEAKSENREPLNLVHRDISPQNVLVGVDGVARVLDFGVAKAQVRSGATKDGQMKGKLSYMSPEQLNGHEVDRRSDVFSAGIVLWEALAGKRLFAGADTGEILAKVLRSEIPPPKSLLPELPDAVSDAVMKALQRDAAERFQTAKEFAVALEHSTTGASAHTIGDWVRDNGGEELAERANLVAMVESHPMDGLDEISSRIEAVRGRPSFPFLDPALPAPEEKAFGAGLLQRDEGWVRRRVIAVALIALAVGSFYAVLRSQKPIEPVPPDVISSAKPSTPIIVPTVPQSQTTAPGVTTAPVIPSTHPSLPAGSGRPPGGGGSRIKPPVNCNPPFTIDARGIKVAKPQCLAKK
jgi:eukaryotic-like serine/threonine-protein kinase